MSAEATSMAKPAWPHSLSLSFGTSLSGITTLLRWQKVSIELATAFGSRKSGSAYEARRNDDEIGESGVAFHPGVDGGLGSGQCGRAEARSQPALHHDHGGHL